MNEALENRLDQLQKLLVNGLRAPTEINFESLSVTPKLPALDIKDLERVESQPHWEKYAPKAPHFLIAWLPPVRKSYDDQVARVRQNFEADLRAHSEREAVRLGAIKERQEEHRQLVHALRTEAEAHNTRLNAWKEAFLRGQKEAIEDYLTLVLSKSVRPDGFPQKFKVAYLPASKQLVMEYELPEMDAVVPACKGYSYVSRHQMRGVRGKSPETLGHRSLSYACVFKG